MIVLGANQYGKAEVRLVKINRNGNLHEIQDLCVTSQLRGGQEPAHRDGDNSVVVATDTQKNTIYGLARERGIASIEEFAILLSRHFRDTFDWITGGRWEIQRYAWDRIDVEGTGSGHSFVRSGGEIRTALVSGDGDNTWVFGGLTDLVLMKSTGSEFHGYPQDRFTTLPETTDRILATSVSARWLYAATDLDYDQTYQQVRQVLLATFAGTHSLGLQHTLYRMGEQVLIQHPDIAEIRFSMPNKHHFLVDLEPFGMDNPGEIYYAADRPYGLIEAAVTRDDAPDAGRAWEGVAGFC